MSQNPACIDPGLLADQSSWVLSLARSLVRDPSGAADVAQETLLAGLAAPPQDASDPRRLRAWLGRVVFNLAHLSTRRSMRRRAREEDVARPESQRSAADTAIHRSVMRRVGEAVEELREPYRSVVIMRYFDGLSTSAIAAASDASESAVRKRLWRARLQLRQNLELQHNGERQAWFQGSLPLLGWGLGNAKPQRRVLFGTPVVLKALAAASLLCVAMGAFMDAEVVAGPTTLTRSTLGELTAQRGLGRPAFLGYTQAEPIPLDEPK